jgi:hypothetical protein
VLWRGLFGFGLESVATTIGGDDFGVMEEGDRSECERILGSRKTAVNVTRRASGRRRQSRSQTDLASCYLRKIARWHAEHERTDQTNQTKR